MRKLLHELRREFPLAKITTTGRGHYRVTLPNGRTVITSNTPSCRRAMHNARAEIRRQSKAEQRQHP
jgi:hypothetical protein